MSVSILGQAHAASTTISKPASTAQGDLLVMLMVSESTSNAPSMTGWTSIGSFSATGAGNTSTLAAFYLVAGASEPASYTFTAGAGASANLGVIFRCSGQDATTQIDAHSTFNSGGSLSTSWALPAMTASVAGDGLLVFVWDWDDGGISTMPLSGTVDFNDAADYDAGHATGLASGTTGTLTLTMLASTSGGAFGVLVKSASSGGTNHGSATLFGMGGIFDGLAGQGALGGGLSGNAGLAPGLSGSGGVGGGLAGHGDITAQSTALNRATAQGAGALGTGLSGHGDLTATPTALASAIISGMGAIFTGLSGQGIIPAVAGSLGGAIHGAATILGWGAMLLGFGGHGDIQAQSAATPTQTLKGAGALGDGLAGAGSVSPSSAATPGITFQGEGAVGTGQAGAGSLAPSGAATPGITFHGMGALLAGLFAGTGTLPPPTATIAGQIVGIFRWLYTAAYDVLQQAFTSRNEQTLGFGKAYNVLGQVFAPRQAQTMVFGGTSFLLMTFVREPTDMVTPNSTIQVIMTAKKFDGTLMSNLPTVTCTVTFPDGTTAAFSLGSGITNTGSGTYTLQYVTKMAGENIEDWVGTDTQGNTCEFHNITPVSF